MQLPAEMMPIARIVARYLASSFVTWGVADQAVADQLAGDPEFVMVVGLVLMAATEAFYALARRLGWPT